MGHAPANVLLRHIHTLAAARDADQASDRDLLRRFAEQRDESAFAALVRRHGPMVLQAGRRTLANGHDAEDVFQATFLVLASRAGSQNWQESVANWLYGVAHHLAQKVRTAAVRRSARERAATVLPAVDPLAEITGRELRSALDEELARLPEKYRAPLVLCYLEGATRDEAARQLALPLGTLKSRVERGRELLRERLTRRGLALGAALSAAALAEGPAPAAQDGLTWAALSFAAGRVPAAGLVSARALDLAKAGVSSVLPLGRMALAAAFLAVTTLALASGPEHGDRPPPAAKAVSPPTAPEQKKVRTDLDGEPLPAEAVARMGSGRLRHGYFLFGLGFLPDGKALVSAGGGSLRLWDPATGKLLRRFGGPDGWTHSFAGADGRLTVARADGNTSEVSAEVLDLASGQVVRRVTFPEPISFYHLALTADGKRLAYMAENTLRVYDVATAREALRIPVEVRVPGEFMFAPDGKSIAVCDRDETVRLYRATDGRLVRVLKRAGDRVLRIAFSPDGRFLASLPHNDKQPGEASVWDLAAGKELHRLTGPGGSIVGAAFSPDGKYLATSCQHPDLVLWDVATGREVRRFASAGYYGRLAFSPDGKTLAAGSAEGVIRLWDVATGKARPGSADPLIHVVNRLRFGPDGQRLLGTAAVEIAWDPATGREIHRFPKVAHDAGPAALSSDESLFADTGQQEDIRLRDAKTGREVRTLKGHTKAVWAVLFAPDGRRLFSSSSDGTLRVWDVATGREQLQLTGQDKRTQYLAASPDGRWLASAGDGFPPPVPNEVFLWDLSAGREKARLAVAGRVSALAFSPDSRSLAVVGGRDGQAAAGDITVWDVAGGKPARAFVGHKGWPGSVAFSPDGRTLATGDNEGSLILWEMRTGRRRHQFTGHESWIAALAFSPDGRRLAASSPEAPVYVWDVAGDFPRRLSAAELERAWKELAGSDAVAAFQAVRRLAAAPDSAVPFLRERLKPAVAVAPQRLRELIRQLDSQRFAERERARGELENLAPRAEASIRREMQKATSLEVRRRLGQILDRQEAGPPEVLRSIRAVEALEGMGTPAARRWLDELAGGAPEAVLTREAAAVRERTRTHRAGER